jgi:hypothetical protein
MREFIYNMVLKEPIREIANIGADINLFLIQRG